MIFWPIFSDELRCVFPIFIKKKTHPNSPLKIAKGAFFSWFWKRSFIYVNLNVDPQNEQKGAVFRDGHGKGRIFWLIFGDELRCVFPIFMKKKVMAMLMWPNFSNNCYAYSLLLSVLDNTHNIYGYSEKLNLHPNFQLVWRCRIEKVRGFEFQ